MNTRLASSFLSAHCSAETRTATTTTTSIVRHQRCIVVPFAATSGALLPPTGRRRRTRTESSLFGEEAKRGNAKHNKLIRAVPNVDFCHYYDEKKWRRKNRVAIDTVDRETYRLVAAAHQHTRPDRRTNPSFFLPNVKLSRFLSPRTPIIKGPRESSHVTPEEAVVALVLSSPVVRPSRTCMLLPFLFTFSSFFPSGPLHRQAGW
jgi:hypothetical protein